MPCGNIHLLQAELQQYADVNSRPSATKKVLLTNQRKLRRATIMWSRLKALPNEVASMHICSFLCLKDVAQLERALVIERDRMLLLTMIRGGPAIALPSNLAPVNIGSLCKWLKVNDLRVSSVHLSDHTSDDAQLALCRQAEEITVHCGCPPNWLRQNTQLCAKVARCNISRLLLPTDPQTWPGKHFHKLQSLSVGADCCREQLVLELLDSNLALRILEIFLNSTTLPLVDDWFDGAAKLCGNLQELRVLTDLAGSTERALLTAVATHCRVLRILHIHRFRSDNSMLPEEPMIAVAQKCKLLQSIAIRPYNITAATVSAICRHCRCLTSLVLPGASPAAADLLHLLPQHRKQTVTELECRWALQQDSEVQACAALLSGLTTLKVTVPVQCERALATAVPYLHGLQELAIAMEVTPATDNIVQGIATACRDLRHLSLTGLPASVHTIVSVIQGSRQLRHFSWEGNTEAANEAAPAALSKNCPMLEYFTTAGISDSAVIAVAQSCKNLYHVVLNSALITDAALTTLGSHCRKLYMVSLLGCTGITEAGILALVVSRSELRYVAVSEDTIDAAAVKRISESTPSVYIVRQ